MKKKLYKKEIIITLLFILYLILFNRTTSIFRSFSRDVDTNVFITSGRLMHEGGLLYKNFYEQKSFSWAIIYYLVTFINHWKYTVILYQTILFVVWNKITYNTTILLDENLKSKKDTILYISTLIFILNLQVFKPEELVLVLNLYSFNLVLKIFKTKVVRNLDFIILALITMFILFIKFTLALPLIMLQIAILWYSFVNKKILNTLIKFTISYLIVFFPILIYLMITNRIFDVYDQYIMWNISYYGRLSENLVKTDIFQNIGNSFYLFKEKLLSADIKYLFTFIFSLFGLVWFNYIYKIKFFKKFQNITYVFLVIIMFYYKNYEYYYILFKLFIVLMIPLALKMKTRYLNQIVLVLFILVIPFYAKSDQIRTNTIKNVCDVIHSTENNNYLDFGNPSTIYNDCNIIPKSYFWFFKPDFTDEKFVDKLEKDRVKYIKKGIPNVFAFKKSHVGKEYQLMVYKAAKKNNYEKIKFKNDKYINLHLLQYELFVKKGKNSRIKNGVFDNTEILK